MNKKVLIISIISVVFAMCLCCIGYVFAVNYMPSPMFLGEEVVYSDNMEVFVDFCCEKYFGGKTLKVVYDDNETEILFSDFASIDVAKTAEKINNKNIFDRNIKPVITIDDNRLNIVLNSFISQVQEFYTVDEQHKYVSIDLEKPIPDINGAALEIENNVKKLDFSDVFIKNIENVNVDTIIELINKEPVNAVVIYDGENESIIKEQKGYEIDKEQLNDYINWNLKQFNVDIIKVTEPDITEEVLVKESFFSFVLSELSSKYSTSVTGRARNVELAAQKINGIILNPGDVFSYNKAVGPRTYENGFKDAGVYTANGLESGVGGGICQVSSTLYGAQLMADLKTVARTNHSYTIGYLPSGQDATVSYGSIDYKFKNDKTFPVKIECTAVGGTLTVKILGSKTDDYKEIKLYNEILSTKAPETIEKVVDDLEPGQQRVAQAGQNGMDVNTYKVYYKDGVKEKTQFIHKSTYIPMNRIIEIAKEETEDTEIIEGEVSEETFEEPIPEENGGLDENIEATFETENENIDLNINQIGPENEQNIVENEEILTN